MSKSLKLKNNNYWDSTGIVHNKKKLSDILYEETILFEGNSNGDISLSDANENYEYIDIEYNVNYASNLSVHRSTRLYETSNILFSLDGGWFDGNAYLFCSIYTLNNSMIKHYIVGGTTNVHSSYRFSSTTNSTKVLNQDDISITKVTGYKKST